MRCRTSDQVLEQLADCVSIASPTPSGDARDVAVWVEQWADDMGARVVREPVWDGADNVLATLSFGPGPRLVLNTHMDVVDPNGQQWLHPPYEPHIEATRMYGRGTCDAKGSLVAMLAAMERLAGESRGLRGEIVLTAVVAEEAGGLGSLSLVAGGFDADAAVVGEPTRLEIATAHKGTYMHEVRIVGRAAHSASPWLGRNAAADGAAFVLACEDESARLGQTPHPLLGPATLTATMFSAGTFQNTVPAQATITVDRRLVPGETHDECDAQLADVIAQVARRRTGLDVAPPRELVATVPSETRADERIVAAGLAALAAVSRPSSAPVGFNAGCDMSKLVGAGIPTIICGPGSLAQAHSPDEFVPLKEVVDAVAVYEHIARTMLSMRQQESGGDGERP